MLSSISHTWIHTGESTRKGKRRIVPLCKLISLPVNAPIFQTGTWLVRPRLASVSSYKATRRRERGRKGEGEEKYKRERRDGRRRRRRKGREVANVAGDSDSGSFGVAPLSLFYRRLPFFPLSLPTPRSSPFSVDPIKGPKRRVSVINLLRVDLIPVFRSLFLSNALVDGPISIPPRLDDKFSKVRIFRETRKYSRSLFYRGWKERRRLEFLLLFPVSIKVL